METIVIPVSPTHPEPEAIDRAGTVLRAGGLVAFPTETVYGLGANALDAAAVRRIFTAKGRPATNPVIVHVASPEMARTVVADWPGAAERLAQRFWPGPLTLVLPKRTGIPDEVTAGGPTVGVRCPAHPVALALITALTAPIAAPSANRSTELSPTKPEHVLHSLNGRIEALLAGGSCSGGIESTVLDLSVTPPRLLRPGLISVVELEGVIGPVLQGGGDGIARSPGQMAKHYVPRTPLRIVEALPATDAKLRIGSIRFDVVGWDQPQPAAARLYETLHHFDETGMDVILVTLPPDTPEWAGVRDRLIRASSPTAPLADQIIT